MEKLVPLIAFEEMVGQAKVSDDDEVAYVMFYEAYESLARHVNSYTYIYERLPKPHVTIPFVLLQKRTWDVVWYEVRKKQTVPDHNVNHFCGNKDAEDIYWRW
jgi:hypothetical protein